MQVGLDQSNVTCFPVSRVAILEANVEIKLPWSRIDRVTIVTMLSSEHVDQNELGDVAVELNATASLAACRKSAEARRKQEGAKLHAWIRFQILNVRILPHSCRYDHPGPQSVLHLLSSGLMGQLSPGLAPWCCFFGAILLASEKGLFTREHGW